MDKGVCSKKIKIVIVGDSTASSYGPEAAPRTGWGQVFNERFSEDIIVLNHAASGRSTKSFIDEGRMDDALNQLAPGDYFFIQFGHNDEKIQDPVRYAEPYNEYKNNLMRFINGAIERKAYSVLLTPIERRDFESENRIKPSHGEYPNAVKELSEEMHIPLIDMTSKSSELFEQLGEEKTKKVFLWLKPGESSFYPEGIQDNTHFQKYGAAEIGRLVTEGLIELKHPLVKYLI